MIGSLLPSVFQNSSLGVHDKGGDGAPAVRNAVSTPLTNLAGANGDDNERGIRHGRHGFGEGRHDFVHSAKHMIRDALKTFSHDLRDSFHDLGFQSDTVMRLAYDVMQAAKQALKSGADFTANLMMAAISQTTTTGAAGTTSAFQMVASEIEITINHSSGSVEVNATNVEIQGQLAMGGGAAMPQLVDFMDTEGVAGAGAAPVLAMNDLDSILAADETEGESEALGPVLAGLPEDVPDASEETAPADETEVAATEEGDDAADPVGEGEDGGSVPLPQFSGVSHVVITAFQRYLNSQDEQITYIKLDATIPLTLAGPETSVVEAITEEVMEEIVDPTQVPPAEQVIEEPVGQPATTDLLA